MSPEKNNRFIKPPSKSSSSLFILDLALIVNKKLNPDIGVPDSNHPDAENPGFEIIRNYSALVPGNHTVEVRLHNQTD